MIVTAILVLAIGLISSPAYASQDDYTVGRYLNSVIQPKPQRTWDEIIAPNVAQVEARRVEDENNKRIAEANAAAAAKLAADAEAARAAEAAASVQRAAAPTAPSGPVYAAVTVSGSCGDWMAAAGITETANAMYIISRESGCNPNARNASSGACGIGQQLPCGKWAHQWNDPVGAMIDMQNYVYGRYGSWANAVAYWQSHGNY